MQTANEKKFFVFALLVGFVLVLVDNRWPVPGFPARYVILSALAFGFLSPHRPWRWAVIITGCLVLGEIFQMAHISGWFWTTLHSSPAVAAIYDRLGTPNQDAPSLVGKLVALAPALAAAYLGQWLAEAAHAQKEARSIGAETTSS
jgi:hypothetical protein